ncbi:MAG: TIGR01777 family oxidoreductase [Deltaproteobacteria bacterium]|nr:TIGR01777 family oxidoreductase [Deltaproteobacteria bacterium]
MIAGGSGVVGRHLTARALALGWQVRLLTRQAKGKPTASGVTLHPWNPTAAAQGDPQALSDISQALHGADFVVNLAGATLGEGRLNARLKERILHSRLAATAALGRAMAQCPQPPLVWGQASASGYFGNTGDTLITEDSPAGDLFLSEVCRRWEDEAARWAERIPKLRLFTGRIGLVLAKDAPAWTMLALPIKLGLGGRLGSGRQWWPWVDADDLAQMFLFVYGRAEDKGVYNFCSPQPVRQIDLARQAARVLGRPCFFPTPAWILKTVVGPGADELILPSCRQVPKRLLAEGFPFQRGGVEEEMAFLLG